MKRRDYIVKIILIVAALYFFFMSIKLMGSAFELFGSGFAETLLSTISNPLVGLFIGILATSIMQSSSTTTSMLVALVATGNVPLRFAIPVVMGANIGTTITNMIVSLSHIRRKDEFKKAFAGATVHDFFNLIAVVILLPLELMTHIIEKSASWLSGLFFGANVSSFNSPLEYIVQPIVTFIKHLTHESSIIMLIVAVVILFAALTCFTKVTRSLVAQKAENFIDSYLFKTPLIAFIVGMIITVVVQSSSVTTSVVVPLVGAGLLTVRKIFPYTLGSNVGTTITAILAALVTGNIIAISVAFAHLIFNVFGIIIIYPLRNIPIGMAEWMGAVAAKSKKIAFIYIITLFFVIPFILIFLTR